MTGWAVFAAALVAILLPFTVPELIAWRDRREDRARWRARHRRAALDRRRP